MHFLKFSNIFYFSIIFLQAVGAQKNNESELQLVLVQALWRHGDRAPQYPYKNDKITEDDWNKIGSGIGQLTNEGLKQQYHLGQAIKQRYIDFLPKQFDPNMIKFRSTNRNRTVFSAKANFLGMFEESITLEKTKFPVYVPENYAADCVNNVMCKCPRRDRLQKLASELQEVKNLTEDFEVTNLFTTLSVLTGEKIDIENFWRIPDTFRCEKHHLPNLLHAKTPWFSDSLMQKLEILNTKINKFTSGIYSNPKIRSEAGKEVDISKEIAKLREGPLVGEIFERMKWKLDSNAGKYLKYYAYSSHDMTLFSLLTALGLQNVTSLEIGGWPPYASAIFVELFVSKTDGKPYFKVIYRTPESAKFENLTGRIPNCHGKSYCELEVFERIYEDLKADLPINEYCQVVEDLE